MQSLFASKYADTSMSEYERRTLQNQERSTHIQEQQLREQRNAEANRQLRYR